MFNDYLMQFVYGFFVSLVCGLAAYFLKVISKSGLIGGVIFGTMIYGCTGWQGFLIPLTFVVIASLATKHGYAKKAAMGIAQEEGGRRGAKHALANILAGTIFAVMTLFAIYFEVFYQDIGWKENSIPLLNLWDFWYRFGIACSVAMVGSFATATADTVSSEMGQLYGKTPINPLTFKRVTPGTEGAISLEGTLLGVLASIIIAGFSILFPTMKIDMMSFYGTADLWVAAVAIVVGAFLGNLFESVIGSFQKIKLDNEILNFLNTLIGGVIAGSFIYIAMMIITYKYINYD
jgi:uncharacterized membrane protein